MDSEYKDKLYSLITQIMELVNDSVGGENAEKFGGLGAIAMLVSAQMIYLAKGSSKEDLEESYDICEKISAHILKEWEIKIDPIGTGFDKATQSPATKFKN